MQTVKIRNIIPSDNPIIAHIIKSVLEELNCNIKGTAYYDKETDAMYQAYQKDKTVYYVAELNGEIVGGCGIGLLENNTCELQKMYILPKARGHKIGLKLLKKNMAFAVANDFDNIYLETFPQMQSAIALYKKNGFYPIQNSLGNTCHYSCNVWMLKPLKRTILALKNEFFDALKDIYPKTEIQHFFVLLAEKYVQMNRVNLALNTDFTPNITQLEQFYQALEQLKLQKPIQYIIGETSFYNSIFKVNSHVLIPRPETEELVAWIIKDHNDKDNLNILDIGTGSGCIAISLAKALHANVSALDVSKEALKIANENAKINKVSIHLIENNILDSKDLKFSEKLDIIVSNPPYVREKEKKQMQNNVLNNEPHLALFVKDENPLLFYDAIADFAKLHLKPNGKLYFEINEFLGNETVEMLRQKGYINIVLQQDMFGRDRMIKCEKMA